MTPSGREPDAGPECPEKAWKEATTMSTPAPEHRTEPPLRVLKRHLPSAAIAFAALWLVVSLAALALPVKYSAGATVQVYPVAGGQAANATNVTPVNVTTEARTASSEGVLQAAATALGGADVDALRRGIQVDAPDGSQNLVIVGTAGSAETAAARANAVAQAYLAARGEMAGSIVRAADGKLSSLIDAWKRDPNLKTRIGELELSRAQLAQVNTLPGALVDPATASGATSSGRAVWGIAAGFVLGLLGAAAAVMWRERTSKISYDAARVAAATGRRVLDWDGDAEGVRRLLLGTQSGGTWTVTGDALASRRFAEALAEGLRERGELVERLDVSDAAELDAGGAGRRLARAAARGGLVVSVDPELGFSRFVRLSQRARPVLVVSKRSRLDVVKAAAGDLAEVGGSSIVFARPGALKGAAPEQEFASAAERALAFERAAREARETPEKHHGKPTLPAPAPGHGAHTAPAASTTSGAAGPAATLQSKPRPESTSAFPSEPVAEPVSEAEAEFASEAVEPEPAPAPSSPATSDAPDAWASAAPADDAAGDGKERARDASTHAAAANAGPEAAQEAPADPVTAGSSAATPSAAPKPGPRGNGSAPAPAPQATAEPSAPRGSDAEDERELVVALSVSRQAGGTAAAAVEPEPQPAEERPKPRAPRTPRAPRGGQPAREQRGGERA